MSIKIFFENYHDTRPSPSGAHDRCARSTFNAAGADEKHFLHSLFVFISDGILKAQ